MNHYIYLYGSMVIYTNHIRRGELTPPYTVYVDYRELISGELMLEACVHCWLNSVGLAQARSN